jgi:hypothetical protein
MRAGWSMARFSAIRLRRPSARNFLGNRPCAIRTGITAIISQNGNAYEEGLSGGWNPIRAYWENPSPANREALRSFLAPETTIWQYTHGVPDPTAVSPDGYSLDTFYLARPGAERSPARSARRLQEQRRALSDLPGVLQDLQAAVPGAMGQERSVLSASWCGGIQTRHAAR